MLRLDSLDAADYLDVVYSVMLDGRSALVSLDDMAKAVDDVLADDWLPNRETWGTGPKAQRGQRAMMELFGPAS